MPSTWYLVEKRFARAIRVAPPINPVAELLRMKLTSNRDKDRVHVRSMDAAGLITDEVEKSLIPELQARLSHIRETE